MMSSGNTPDQGKLSDWIKLYKEEHGPRLDDYLKHFADLKHFSNRSLALEHAIREAAEGKGGKIHPHQYRVGAERLATMADKLASDAKQIEGVSDFDALHNLIAHAAIEKFGKLAIYDTALRLAFHLGKRCHPTDVYLHAGARAGWRQFKDWGLITADAQDDKLKMADLPELRPLLAAYHVENFLCIFKHGKPEDCDPRDGCFDEPSEC